MDVRFVLNDLARIDALRYEAVALPFFEDERPLRGTAGLCDWRLCGRLSAILTTARVTGSLAEVTLLPARPRLPFDKMLLVGCGLREGFDEHRFRAVTTAVFEAAQGLRLRNLALALPGRGAGCVTPGDAMRWFLDAAGESALEEAVVLDDSEAVRAMLPIVESERRRVRATARARDEE